MAAQYHSKICARAHSAMEELFGAGLLDANGMYEFDILCRSDVKSDSAPRPPRRELVDAQPPAPQLGEFARQPSSPPSQSAVNPARVQRIAPRPSLGQQPPSAKPAAAPLRTNPSSGAISQHRNATAFYVTTANAVAMSIEPAPASRPKAASRPTLVAAPRPSVAAPSLKKQSSDVAKPRPPAPASTAGSRQPTLPRVDDWQFPAREPQPEARQATARKLGPKELRALREREGVSEAVFARCLDVPPQTIIAWEAGLAQPGAKTLRLLAAIEERGLSALN